MNIVTVSRVQRNPAQQKQRKFNEKFWIQYSVSFSVMSINPVRQRIIPLSCPSIMMRRSEPMMECVEIHKFNEIYGEDDVVWNRLLIFLHSQARLELPGLMEKRMSKVAVFLTFICQMILKTIKQKK